MEITQVRVLLVPYQPDNRLFGFATIAIDDMFVIHDLKIIGGDDGRKFVSMPARKVMFRCETCQHKNHAKARFCNQCGRGLPSRKLECDEFGKSKLFVDIAHPITPEGRTLITTAVLKAFQLQLRHAAQTGEIPALPDDKDLHAEVA